MNFDGLFVFDIYGVERLPLAGELEASRLADRLVQEWIPYYECHKCGRFDYCKYVQRLPQNPILARDIKCGVVESALRLFVEHTFDLLGTLKTTQRQDYLDAAFHYTQFVLDAEIDIGRYMNPSMVKYWMDLGPRFYGVIVGLRQHLDRIAENLKSIPDFYSQQPVLFVEGYSEEAFLSKLRESHSTWFLDLIVEVYGGRGNRKLKRIEMLLERYKRQGYKVYIQGDADGSGGDCFQHIVTKGLVTPDRTFVFVHDFETSIPLELLLSALKEMGELEEVTASAFREKLGNYTGPVRDALRRHYSLDLDSLKLTLATQVADLLNRPHATWWRDERFLQTELGRFLQFVMRVF